MTKFNPRLRRRRHSQLTCTTPRVHQSAHTQPPAPIHTAKFNTSLHQIENMEAVLFRTSSGSIPVLDNSLTGSPRLLSVPLAVPLQISEHKTVSSSLHMMRRNIRRCSSEPNIIKAESRALSNLGSRSFTAPRIPEDEDTLGGGMNNNGGYGGGGSDGYAGGDECKMGDYYKQLLKRDPTNSLLLINYGRYLHEVERDYVKAEEYYSRAILGSPGDGEVLSLYGKLIWETHRDEMRAKSYFHQALQASPHDCMVVGSYAHFLWEAEEEQEDEDERVERSENKQVIISKAAVVEAF